MHVVRSQGRWLGALLLGGSLWALAAVPVHAQQPAPEQPVDMKALLERMDRLEKQNQELTKKLEEQQHLTQTPPAEVKDGAAPAVPGAAIDNKSVEKIVDDYLKAHEDKKKAEEVCPDVGPTEKTYEVGKNLEFKAYWKDGLWFETVDKAFTFHAGGRLDFDTTWYGAPHSVSNSIGQFNNYLDPNQGLSDGWDVRRFRLRFDGDMWEQFYYRLEVEFAGGLDLRRRTLGISPAAPATGVYPDYESVPAVRMTDVYLEYKDIPLLGTLRAGHQRETLSFSNASSENFQPFMERPMIFNAFNNDYQFDNGLVLHRTYLCDRLYTWGGVFRTSDVNDNEDRDGGFSSGDGKYAYDFRATALPVWLDGGREWMMLGAAYSYREMEMNQTRFRAVPEVQAAAQGFQLPSIINTGTILSTGALQILNFEAASAWGPLTLTAEWSGAQVTDTYTSTGALTVPSLAAIQQAQRQGLLPRGGPQALAALGLTPHGTYNAQGFYVEALYFLTGDHRPFRLNQPAYERVPVEQKAFFVHGPHGNIFATGAWEVGARYEWINLCSHGINGGFAHSVTLGLNWYMNDNMRIQFNYLWMNRNFEPTDTAGRQEGDFDGLGIRYHMDY